MIVDSSALVAILTSEPERDAFLRLMAAAPIRRLSAPSLLETSVVLNRMMGSSGEVLLEDFLTEAEIEVMPMTADQARAAFGAYRRFGKGMRHPAQLNILDCCTYALAAEYREPLLFKGADFGKTDLALAIESLP
jgi:ribonuclease VapC